MTPEHGDLLEKHLRERGKVALTFLDGRFAVASQWGQEAPDSPMAGAAAYGTGDTLDEALAQFFHDTGPVVGVQQTCPKPWITNCRRAARNESETYCRRSCFDALDADIKDRVASGT